MGAAIGSIHLSSFGAPRFLFVELSGRSLSRFMGWALKLLTPAPKTMRVNAELVPRVVVAARTVVIAQAH